jgi:hypothetical protein
MKLINEIIEILSSDTGKLSEALIKTKVLLHEIGHKELVTWVNSELNGYPDRDSVPDYRILHAQVLVNASNMAYQVTRHPIPLGHLDTDHRKDIETAKMDQSLAVLEQFAEKDHGNLQGLIPMESYGFLGKGLDNSYQIMKAWSEISTSSVVQILIQVRSRLLDFVLDLKDQFPDELNQQEMKEKISTLDAENLFNNAIFGDNATILVGNQSSQNISNMLLKGNFEALKQGLINNGATEEDVNSLKIAIDNDDVSVTDEEKQFGPEVKSWMQTMMGKAIDTSWQIELGVAGGLLSTALNNYYGLF